MYKIKINDSLVIASDPGADGSYTLDGTLVKPDIFEIRDGVFHVILNNRSYNAEVLRHDADAKTFEIRVNNNTYKVELKDRYDDLLKALGLDTLHTGKAADLKAPMPGMVVEVAVKEGQEVKKGDKLVVLEAMKMENILKASADAVVKKVNAAKGRTVEKNEILVLFN
jgi:acetyl/propionyl-CoA carboxylase alpha subunit